MKGLEKPVLTTAEDMENLLGKITTGGLTVVENSSAFGIEFSLYFLKVFSEKSGIPLLIEDIFDTFPVYAKHLELMGFSMRTEDVDVIKVGGSQEVGRVIGRIKFEEDPNVYQMKLERELEKVPYEKYVHIVLGLERLLMFQRGIYNVHTLMNIIRGKLGSGKSKNIYIIEVPVLKKLEFNPLPLLEDIATSVVHLSDEDELVKIRFKKAILTLRTRRDRILVSPREIIRWWG